MIIPQSIVERWYETDHPIYKNFKFIFQNQLWQTRVPVGFSVCPYFWMSMILGLLILRPIVYIIYYLIRPLMKLGGKPLAWVDVQFRKLLQLIDPTLPLGEAKGAGLLILAVLFMAGLLLKVLIKSLIVAYFRSIAGHLLPSIFFWGGIGAVVLILVTALYNGFWRGDRQRCKVHAWLLVWLTGVFAAAWIASPLTMAMFFAVVGKKTFFGLGWLLWWIAHICAALGLFCWVGLKAFYSMLAFFFGEIFKWGPTWGHGVPWIIIIPVGTLLWGYLMHLVLNRFSETARIWDPTTPFSEAEKQKWENQRKEHEREHWFRHLAGLIKGTSSQKIIEGVMGRSWLSWSNAVRSQLNSKYPLLYNENWVGIRRLSYKVIDLGVRQIFANTVERLVNQEIYVPSSPGYWLSVHTLDDAGKSFIKLRLKLRSLYPEAGPNLLGLFQELRWNEDVWNSLLPSFLLTPEFEKTYKEEIKHQEWLTKVTQERQSRAEKSKARQLCKEATEAILRFFRSFIPILLAIPLSLLSIWHGLRWFGREVRTLVAYLWMLGKAKKHKACPYFMFRDPSGKTSTPSNSIPPVTG